MQEKLTPQENPLQKSAQYIKGVGPRRYELLNRLGIYTIEDLLSYFPRRYEDRSSFTPVSKLVIGESQTIKGQVMACGLRRARRGIAIYEVAVADSTGVLYAIWFNQPFMRNVFRPGQSVVFYGKVEKYKRLQMNSPEYEIMEDESKDSLNIGRIVPVYSLTENITQKYLRKITYSALTKYSVSFEDSLSTSIRARYRFLDLETAMKNIHYPRSFQFLELARRRLVFEEFFALQVAIALRKNSAKKEIGVSHRIEGELTREFLSNLPFELTKDQLKVIKEIETDMNKPSPMNRLLQGDVGSGKTVVAAYALALAIQNGYQGALMAPTEILAEQHYYVLSKMLLPLGIKVELLISGLSDPAKDKVRDQVRSGQIQLIVGTHALIQENVEFSNLGLVVIDEQHKFGVVQRAALKQKGLNPDILVMTATPIPRTLALTFYGDFDISTIKELPSGRKPISTYWVGENKRQNIYDFIRNQLKEGRQAYMVCPLIEESDKIGSSAAKKMHEKARYAFADFRVGLLHGKMSAEDKEKVMKDFKNKKIDILVATVVIEVGIDVPNASVMLIENAERFGLSQLHQLRGRIGRGEYESYCILVSDESSEEARKRLQAMTQTQDGFRISQEDLMLRGPGEFLGTRQSGLPEFKIADIIADMKLLEAARFEAGQLIRQDPELTDPSNAKIKKMVRERFKDKIELAAI